MNMTPPNAQSHREVPLCGYVNRLSARAGETLEFKVSNNTDSQTVSAALAQSICADPNPAGPGIIEKSADQWLTPTGFTATHQPFYPGSYAITDHATSIDAPVVELSAIIWPTLKKSAMQTVLSRADLSLHINEDGCAAIQWQNHNCCCEHPLQLHTWTKLTALINRSNGTLTITTSSPEGKIIESKQYATGKTTADKNSNAQARISIAAAFSDETASQFFNGKIESPKLQTGDSEKQLLIYAEWDFSSEISSTTIVDTGPNSHHGQIINLPARAMTSSQWDGSEMCWRHATQHYSAIHFHEDDIIAFDWQTSFTYTIPEGMPSGIYVLRISAGNHQDAIPFYICADHGKPTNRLCVLIPTFTYAVYGNHARPDWAPSWNERNADWKAYPWNPAEYPAYGQSTYNFHSDGSGICHASHERPLFNMRPGYITFGNTKCSGLRHFQADSHLIAWLTAQDIPFDIITDRELHNEGVSAIAKYDAVMTTSHPEYHTPESLNALTDYRDDGGNLMYLGGNGFYWRIALHPENPHHIEIRRAEDGIRAWAAEPGEYFQAFDGAYGGLWRRNGRPPQKLCGVGFSAQGQFNGSYYRRLAVKPELDWIFDGITDETLGDFGLCGGGAAGFELDRADTRLGTPEAAIVIARSENHSDDFILVPEEMLTHITTLPGPPAADLIHADIVWFDTEKGGSVFSVGSITFCGSLPHNNYENNISTLLGNVVNHMLNKTQPDTC